MVFKKWYHCFQKKINSRCFSKNESWLQKNESWLQKNESPRISQLVYLLLLLLWNRDNTVHTMSTQWKATHDLRLAALWILSVSMAALFCFARNKLALNASAFNWKNQSRIKTETLVLVLLVLVFPRQIHIKKNTCSDTFNMPSYTSLYFHSVVGTESYATSTTNMYPKHFTYRCSW